jgi:hypothetical protein
VTPLSDRKRVLIQESERNRELLARDLGDLRRGLRSASARAGSLGSMVSSAVVLLTGATTAILPDADGRGSAHPWLRRLLKGAGLAADLWQAFRPAPSADSRRPGADTSDRSP